MTHFGYIDESGTKDDQEVMTVALVVMEGGATAAAVQKHLLKTLHPKHKTIKQNRTGPKPMLHYSDMKIGQVRACGQVLSTYPFNCFSSYYYHDGAEKPHDERHAIYLVLVESCIKQALEFYDDVEISIGQQGNWESYAPAMTKRLEALVAEYGKRYGFKQVRLKFLSAAKPGIQIADFYAGAVRGHVLRHKDDRLGVPYDQISGQVREVKLETMAATVKRKR